VTFNFQANPTFLGSIRLRTGQTQSSLFFNPEWSDLTLLLQIVFYRLILGDFCDGWDYVYSDSLAGFTPQDVLGMVILPGLGLRPQTLAAQGNARFPATQRLLERIA
jgi:hypothetical protein